MKKLFGFTLIEMTIAICVIAVLSAAITPYVTKKLHTKAKANANQLTTDCEHFNFTSDITGTSVNYEGYCKSCYEHKCVSCKLDYLDGYLIDQNTCKYIKCSDKFSGCNNMCSEFECLDAVAPIGWSYQYQDGNKSKTITPIKQVEQGS